MGIYLAANVNDSVIYNNTLYNIGIGADYGMFKLREHSIIKKETPEC